MDDEPTVGMRLSSAGQICLSLDCMVMVFAPHAEGCPACGGEGQDARFGVGFDEITE